MDSAAVFARGGPHIARVKVFGVWVVFDHDDTVAQIAQAFQGFQQAPVIPLMQADGRFIQEQHDARQSRTDLAGERGGCGHNLSAG